MKFFGPATITHNGVDIGKTTGGGDFSVEISRDTLLDGSIAEYAHRGEGVLHMYEWADNISLSSSLTLNEYAAMVAAGSGFTITFNSAKLLVPATQAFGTLKQTTMDIRFVFKQDGSGNLVTMES